MPHGKKITDQQVDRMIELYKKYRSCETVGKIMKLDGRTISKYLKLNNIPVYQNNKGSVRIKTIVVNNKTQYFKQCTVCKEYKPYAAFYKSTDTRIGLSSRCKNCKNIQSRSYFKNMDRKAKLRYYKIKNAANRRQINSCPKRRARFTAYHRAYYYHGKNIKYCPECGEYHKLSPEFWYESRNEKDGFFDICKRCSDKQMRAINKMRRE